MFFRGRSCFTETTNSPIGLISKHDLQHCSFNGSIKKLIKNASYMFFQQKQVHCSSQCWDAFAVHSALHAPPRPVCVVLIALQWRRLAALPKVPPPQLPAACMQGCQKGNSARRPAVCRLAGYRHPLDHHQRECCGVVPRRAEEPTKGATNRLLFVSRPCRCKRRRRSCRRRSLRSTQPPAHHHFS